MTTKTEVDLRYVATPRSDIREAEEGTLRTSFHLRDRDLDAFTLMYIVSWTPASSISVLTYSRKIMIDVVMMFSCKLTVLQGVWPLSLTHRDYRVHQLANNSGLWGT
jgi:hypothetical protein